jgi:hypothetical protein
VSPDGYRLGSQVCYARTEYGDNPRIEDTARWQEVKTSLDNELTPLGFSWTVQRHHGWIPEFINHLEEYAKEYGHANPPQNHDAPDGYQLGKRARHVRIHYSDGTVQHREATRVLRKELDALGFRWQQRHVPSDVFLQQLKAYAVANGGSLSPPQSYVTPDRYRLGRKVHNVRVAYRRAAAGGSLSPAMAGTIEELNKMGFPWNGTGKPGPRSSSARNGG